MNGALALSIRHAGEVTVVTVAGEVDIVTAPQLRAVLADVVATAPPILVADMTAVPFCGSAGLSALLQETEYAPGMSVRVVASAPVRRIIEVTGLAQVLALFDTVEAACLSA
ncbi:STAS domain-containing protein [Nocardia sp. NBC_01388]|uniref:STAS domain-containing protein n=1 Tax=Nocardia sp. NBC_01388 TaxID=2903596 RepID=UPI002F917324